MIIEVNFLSIVKRIFIVLVIILFACGQQETEHKKLGEIAAELQNQCPKMLDEATRWDKVSVYDNNLELTFTLVKMDKDSTDTEGLTKELKCFLSKNLSRGFNLYKSHIDLVFMRNNNVVFHYIYLDKRKRILSDITIKPEEYIN